MNKKPRYYELTLESSDKYELEAIQYLVWNYWRDLIEKRDEENRPLGNLIIGDVCQK